jgi:hypothetical protein
VKTTLVIDDGVMKRLRQEAVRQGQTVSKLVEAAIRALLDKPKVRRKLPPLPAFDSGGAYLDVSNRDLLYKAMEEEL